MELFNPVISNDLFYLQEVLMENPGIDVNQAVIGSMTALHVAAEKGYSSCVKVLLAAGANIDSVDEHGCTSLMNAVAADWPLVVVTLMQAHCDVNLASRNGMRALHLAARQGSPGVVQLLLRAGARPHVRNNDDKTPLGMAVELGHTAVTESLLLGCRHVNPRLIATTAAPTPLLSTLQKGRFLIGVDLLLTGYFGHAELRTHMTGLPRNLEFDSAAEKASFKTLTLLLKHPLSLQQQTRIAIRRALNFDIWQKVGALTLPFSLREYICFQDIYKPPCLQTANDVYCFFNDNAREIY